MTARREGIPHSWEIVKVGDLARYINGLPFKPTDWEKDGRPIIRIQNLTGSNKNFNFTTKNVGDDFIVRPGNILVSWSATLDAFIWEGPEAVLNQHIFKVEPFEDWIDPAFLFWGLKEVIQEMWQSEHTHGSTMKHINRGPFLAHDFPLPPFAEQRRIAAKLRNLMDRVDACRKRLEQVPRLLKQFRQSALAAAFTGKLTAEFRKSHKLTPVSESLAGIEVPPRPNRFASRTNTVIDGDYALAVNKPRRDLPEGWEWIPLVDIARMESGHTPSRSHPEYWGGDIPWIGIADASDGHGKTISTTYQHTNQMGLDNSAARLLPAGTICLSRTASVGYVVRMGVPMATSQDFANWTCTSAIDPDWLKFLFVAETNAIYRFGEGSTHTTVYFPELLSFYVALPPIEEQQEIVRRVEALFKIADVVEDSYRKAWEQLEKLPQAILAKAFRGELVPQDPNDEPASALLERIRAERASGEKAAQKAKQPRRKAGRQPAGLPFAKSAEG